MDKLANTIKNFKSRGFDLYPHQIEGIEWMLLRESQRGNCGLLCDEPGLGKTVQICGLLDANPQYTNLLILPVNLIDQWKCTLERLLPNHSIYIHHGKDRLKTISLLKEKLHCPYCIVISTIQLASKDSCIQLYKWNRIIIDEIHQIRNPKSVCFQGIKAIHAKFRWGMTGTPLHNTKDDLKTLYMFLFPTITKVSDSDLEKLNSILIKRRKKEEIQHLQELAKNIDYFEYILNFRTSEEREIYIKIKESVSFKLKNILNDDTLNNSQKMIVIFELIIRLRQASIHPSLSINALKKNYETDLHFDDISTKFCKSLEIVKEKTSKKENTIIFCNFLEEMTQLQKFFKQNNINSELYNGKLSLTQKKEVLEKFTHPDTFTEFSKLDLLNVDILNKIYSYIPTVLLIQIKSGGVGLNLQNFNNIIFNSPDWNPSNEVQAIARSHRMGQSRRVNIYHLLLKDQQESFNTIDERIIQVQTKKKLMIKKILMEATKDDILKHEEIQKAAKLSIRDYKTILS